VSDPTRTTPPDAEPNVSAELLSDFAHDVVEQLSVIEEATNALRLLATSMCREADRARGGQGA
jgi:hypothetical protein